MRRARSTTGASTSDPSSSAAPRPSAAAWSAVSTTRLAQATESAERENTRFTVASCPGWMHAFPPKPSERASSASCSRPASSSTLMCTMSKG
jgi:hypothetical protein